MAIISPALLLIFWENTPPKKAFFIGAIFGLGFFTAGVSWVYISLHDYGGANALLAGALTFLMIVVLLSYTAIAGYLLNRYFSSRRLSRYILVFPSLWVLGEWARGWVFTGFPWLFLGYSQLNTVLAGWAPIVGVFGISWIVASTAGLVAYLAMTNPFMCPWSLERTKYVAKQSIGSILFLLLLWFIGYLLTFKPWTQPEGKPLQVSLVQGNIPQTLKWDPAQAQASLVIYEMLTKQHWNSSLIVWPEAAITLGEIEAKEALDNLNKVSKEQHATLITGLPTEENTLFYNSLTAVGNGEGIYRKRHLVPFGEFMPLRRLLDWLDNYVQIPMSDYSAGTRHQSLITVNHLPVAAFICYEIAYPSEVLDMLPDGRFLIVLSDDSWFGKSLALPQHLQIAQMRALETGRYLLMSTNSGITAIIDAQGKIQSQLPAFERSVLTGNIQPMVGATPWVRLGVYPIMLMMAIFLTLAFFTRQRD